MNIGMVIIYMYGNQKYNYLNALKAEQLLVGKQLLVSTSLINPFGTSIIDQHIQESIMLIGFITFFPSRVTVFSLSSFQINFKGHTVAITEFPE